MDATARLTRTRARIFDIARKMVSSSRKKERVSLDFPRTATVQAPLQHDES
jgi:hypothetical protein